MSKVKDDSQISDDAVGTFTITAPCYNHHSSVQFIFQATLTPVLGLVVVFVEGLSAGDLHPLSIPHTWIACCLEKWIQQKSQQTNAQ